MDFRQCLRPLVAASVAALVVAGSLVGQAAAKPKPKDNGVRCAIWDGANGGWDYYLPGETVAVHDGYGAVTYFYCQADGTWLPLKSPTLTSPGNTLPPTLSQPPAAIR